MHNGLGQSGEFVNGGSFGNWMPDDQLRFSQGDPFDFRFAFYTIYSLRQNHDLSSRDVEPRFSCLWTWKEPNCSKNKLLPALAKFN